MNKIKTIKEDNRILFYLETNDKYLGYAYLEIDGFYVFVFDKPCDGSWSAYALKWIAEKLDELNKPYEDYLKSFVEECNHPTENQVSYHDSTILCTKCNHIIAQFGEKIVPPVEL